MTDQNKLLECMEEIKAIASSQQNHLTKEEITRYLADMELDEKQFEAVFAYLAASRITIEGYKPVSPIPAAAQGTDSFPADSEADRKKTAPGTTASPRTSSASKASRNLAKYRSEVSSLTTPAEEQLTQLWSRYLSGDASVRETLIHAQLPIVIRIAETYRKHGVALDETIAEGNIGILTAMQKIQEHALDYFGEAIPDMNRIQQTIEQEIRTAIETMIDSETMAKNWENAIVAKTNLLHEAAKYLAEENGRAATQTELAEYTRIPVAEIHDIMELSKDTKQISNKK